LRKKLCEFDRPATFILHMRWSPAGICVVIFPTKGTTMQGLHKHPFLTQSHVKTYDVGSLAAPDQSAHRNCPAGLQNIRKPAHPPSPFSPHPHPQLGSIATSHPPFHSVPCVHDRRTSYRTTRANSNDNRVHCDLKMSSLVDFSQPSFWSEFLRFRVCVELGRWTLGSGKRAYRCI
jgi:hypothetical protein